MDTGGGNHRAPAAEEFLRKKKVNGVVSCSLRNSDSQAGTHHSFWHITYQWATDSYICLVAGLGLPSQGLPSQARGRDRTFGRN